MKFPGREELIKSVQHALGLKDDGIDGRITWNAIADKLVLKTETPIEPQPTQDIYTLAPKALKLILDHEVGGGESYYNKLLKKPTYPGGASGVTIGVGYDLGYNSFEQFKKDWQQHLNDDDFVILSKCLGKTGSSASALIKSVKHIQISWEAALEVFKKSTLPRFIDEAIKAFPGSQELCPEAFGALVSLVFNRGGSTSGDRRREMLNIRLALRKEFTVSNIYTYIAQQIRSMKRLWVGSGLDGLLRRRDEEASLVESCK